MKVTTQVLFMGRVGTAHESSAQTRHRLTHRAVGNAHPTKGVVTIKTGKNQTMTPRKGIEVVGQG